MSPWYCALVCACMCVSVCLSIPPCVCMSARCYTCTWHMWYPIACCTEMCCCVTVLC